MSRVLQIRIDESIKERSDFVLKSIGLDLSTAIRMFLIKVIRTGGLPFEPINEELEKEDFKKALKEMQKNAKEAGLDKMTLDEINAIIKEVRKEQKGKQ